MVTVKARLSGFDRNLEEAAMDLGANELVTFWKITFPLILPGILAAALLAFSLSIDDFVITNFVSGTTNTFPIWIYGVIRERAAGPDQRHRLDDLPRRRRAGRAQLMALGSARPASADSQEADHARDRAPAPTPPRSPTTPSCPAVWSRITNLDVDRGEGSWLITRDGERYLDYSSGIGVTNTGHAHPRVAAAIAAQATKLLHGQQNILYHEPGLRLYERLRHVLPGGPWQAFLSNSGAEAVEASVKLARVATGPAGHPRLPLRLPRPDRRRRWP